MNRPLVALTLLAFLSACASSTLYSPAERAGDYGYSEQQIEENRFRIMFRGNSFTDRETVETFLLFRAAEVTIEQGFDHFIVVSDDTERRTSYTGNTGTGFFPFYGAARPFPYYAYGYPWGPLWNDPQLIERTRYTAMAYIILGRGEKPLENPTAYDARSVIENLRSAVILPDQS